MDLRLKARLWKAAGREGRSRFCLAMALVLAVAAVAGFASALVARWAGWGSGLVVLTIAVVGIAGMMLVIRRRRGKEPDWRGLAQALERRYPALEGRLVTAVQQEPEEGGRYNCLQEQVLLEVVRHSYEADWSVAVPKWRLWVAQGASVLALGLCLGVLLFTRDQSHPLLAIATPEKGPVITPGDISLERGSTLVVMARFEGAGPASAELVLGSGPVGPRLPLVKSLSDPVFGGQIAGVTSNFEYSVQYGGRRTRAFAVTVFEYPRLEKSDAVVKYPEYTGQGEKRIADTRRLSAVEGSELRMELVFNKPVAKAELVPRNQAGRPIAIDVETNRPAGRLAGYLLEANQTLDLRLVDFEGRTNRVPAQFVMEALKNRVPEVRLAFPRGDIRPSPVEEVAFEGTVWDDFGVEAFGIGYVIAGQEPQYIELGNKVGGKQKQPFKHYLRLEDMRVEPDQLLSWFTWADDLNPKGEIRRTAGDLYFAEIRPFEEVFREGQDGEPSEQQPSGESGQGGRTGKLAEIQKQILSATWKLHRDKNGAMRPRARETKGEKREESRRSGASSGLLGGGAVSLKSGARESGPVASGPADAFLRDEAQGGFLVGRRDKVFGQSGRSAGRGQGEAAGGALPSVAGLTNAASDAAVVREAQGQLLKQVRQALERSQDPRSGPLWRAAARDMERALERLERAGKDSAALEEALAAEQAAYQALLKLQEHEYQVSRSRRQNRGQQGGNSEQMQRELEQLDLTQTENRYETQRLAQRPQTLENREQLQVMNRLQELARRQQDVNERLKELEAALREARTENEREELRRQLKRLQEEERQMLADLDELRQRMDRPENQSEMADERRELDQAREAMQRASEAAAQGATAEALASGTRAQRQLQDLREQMRKENSSQFAEGMRDMRTQARELAKRQEELLKQMQGEANPERRTLSDTGPREQVLEEVTRQQQRLTNLLSQARQVSDQAESSEPIVARELYDALRTYSQESTRDLQEIQEQLLTRGLMTRNLYNRLQGEGEPEGSKLLEVASEMLRLDITPAATDAAQRSQEAMQGLRQGIERAAQSVLGDDTEALRLAEQELERLTKGLEEELARNQKGGAGAGATNGVEVADNRAAQGGANRDASERPSDRGEGRDPRQQSTDEGASPEQPQNTRSQGDREPGANRGGGQPERAEANSREPAEGIQPNRQSASNRPGQGGGADIMREFDRVLNEQSRRQAGPITGDEFGPWSDRLRNVEEMIDEPALRTGVARARERARDMRQEYKREGKAPDWAVVQLQVIRPLVEVRERVREELARRESKEALVPIDRDPVPNRYTDLVRRYYERLGKDR